MTVEFINNQHILYPKVKVLGKQCADNKFLYGYV